MGEVFKARDTRLDRIVAIKTSKIEFSERFEREARAVAALNHPHICQLYDVGPNYLVMEYIEGAPLKGPLPLDQALKYAAQICDALDAAHKKNITHRDLKPANILVTKAGVKLLDFGLPKIAPAIKADDATMTMGLTGKGEILGTLVYMSPEQVNGEDAGPRSDIFSFGLVLYEMLTGKRAFAGATPASVIAAILERPAPSVADVAPTALDRVLRKCLEKDPEDRWQSARDLKSALEWMTVTPETAATAPSPSRLGRLPWIAAAVLAGVAAVAVGAVALYPAPERKPLVRLEASLGPDAVAGADVAISPDGQWIGFFAENKIKKVSLRGGAPVTLSDAVGLFGASWGETGEIVVSIFAVGALQSVPASGGLFHSATSLGQGELTHHWPQVLAGGNAVLFTASRANTSFEDATIQVVSLKTGATKTLLSGGYFGRYLPTNGATGHLVYVHQCALYAVGFDPVRLEVRGSPEPILEDVADATGTPFDVSRNGTFVYHAGAATEQKWPVGFMDSSGKIEPLVTTPGNYSYPRISPDGKRLALSVDTGKGREIFVYDRQRDALSSLTFGGGDNLAPAWSRDGEHLVFGSRNAAGSRVNWIRADGSGENQVLLESKNRASPSGFSPDGRRLAYSDGKPDGDIDLWSLPLDTSDPEHPKAGKPTPFLQTPAVEAGLVFSPDSRYIAYFSNESG